MYASNPAQLATSGAGVGVVAAGALPGRVWASPVAGAVGGMAVASVAQRRAQRARPLSYQAGWSRWKGPRERPVLDCSPEAALVTAPLEMARTTSIPLVTWPKFGY